MRLQMELRMKWVVDNGVVESGIILFPAIIIAQSMFQLYEITALVIFLCVNLMFLCCYASGIGS